MYPASICAKCEDEVIVFCLKKIKQCPVIDLLFYKLNYTYSFQNKTFQNELRNVNNKEIGLLR